MIQSIKSIVQKILCWKADESDSIEFECWKHINKNQTENIFTYWKNNEPNNTIPLQDLYERREVN